MKYHVCYSKLLFILFHILLIFWRVRYGIIYRIIIIKICKFFLYSVPKEKISLLLFYKLQNMINDIIVKFGKRNGRLLRHIVKLDVSALLIADSI